MSNALFFVSVNDGFWEELNVVFHVFFRHDEATDAIRVVTYGRFDFTGDLRLPRSNASPKKGYCEKRNIVAIFPQRKTYSWSDKNASSTRW